MKRFINCFNLASSRFIVMTFLITLNSSFAFSFNYKAYRAETAPIIDGIGDEYCWSQATWALINQPFDGQTVPDSIDFYGRYKILWTSSRLYVLMEITDDNLVDNRVDPSDYYWEDDCTEFFIDEDHLPQGHECGAEAFNAFAYHIAAVARDKNNYTNGSILSYDSPDAINHVIDLGTDCNTGKALNLDDHVKVKLSKNGNRYTWELEFKIFDNSYNQNSDPNTPVTLEANKVMGFAIAYCDDDDGNRDNMIGTIPNHNDYSGPYPFYRYTNEFGTLTLSDSLLATSAININTNSPCNINSWPNPVGNTLNIKMTGSNSSLSHIKITSLSGQTVLCREIVNSNLQVDVSNLPSGVYILEAMTSGMKHYSKFLKE